LLLFRDKYKKIGITTTFYRVLDVDIKLQKIGGSVITERTSNRPEPRLEEMKRIAKEISEGLSEDYSLALVHGGGSHGHQIVDETEIDKGIDSVEDLMSFSITQSQMDELNYTFTNVLQGEDVPAFSTQPSASAIMKDGKLENMDYEAVGGLLGEGLVPVLYGVPAYDTEKGCSILSGDEILPYLGDKFEVEEVLHGTNVRGIYPEDPKDFENDDIVDRIDSMDEAKNYLGGSQYTDVTGGMRKKVEYLFEYGVPGRIFDATESGNVRKVLDGEDLGTYISP